MALTVAQQAYFRTKLGTTLNEADIEVRLLRLGGTGFEALTASEILEQRVADMMLKPTSFSVAGEYSEDRAANLKALQETLAELQTDAGVGDSVARVVPSPPSRFAR